MEKRLLGTRHAEARLIERSPAISVDHLVDVSRDSAYQIDVRIPEKIVEGVAHRAADDDADAELLNFADAFEKRNAFYRNRPAGDFPFPVRFQYEHLGAGVQNRRDPSPENGNGGSGERCRPARPDGLPRHRIS